VVVIEVGKWGAALLLTSSQSVPLSLSLSPPPYAQVLLKERSVKDLESTHTCTQVFVVVSAQPRSVQVDIGDHRYLVSPGDHFFVPQNCEYRLTNHSMDTPAEVAFVVIKPRVSDSAPTPAK
jgi:mannose-6-phosphate isomerase-like protein (cupin superfamily)